MFRGTAPSIREEHGCEVRRPLVALQRLLGADDFHETVAVEIGEARLSNVRAVVSPSVSSVYALAG
jgi:hypothetical protein